MELAAFKQLIAGSKEFTFHGSVLEVAGYYSGIRVKLDLSKMDEQMLKALLADAEDENEEA